MPLPPKFLPFLIPCFNPCFTNPHLPGSAASSPVTANPPSVTSMKSTYYSPRHDRLLWAIASVFLLLLQPAWAAVIKLDPSHFPDPKWSVMPYGSGTVHQPYAETANLHDKTWLLIRRTGSTAGQNANSAQIIYNGGSTNDSGNPVSAPANQLGDFTGSVILGATSWNDFTGVVLRGAGATFSSGGYHLGIAYPTIDGERQYRLVLAWDVKNGYVSEGIMLKTSLLTSAPGTLTTSNNNQYILEFSFIGNHLEASFSIWNPTTQQKGSLLGSLSYTDTRPQARDSGYFGIRGGRYGGPGRGGYFREIQVTTIPEPSSVALLLLSAGALLLVRKRRKICSN